MSELQNKILDFLKFLSWIWFRSQGLITYYFVDNFAPNLRIYWIIYFIVSSYLINLSEIQQKPLLSFFNHKNNKK